MRGLACRLFGHVWGLWMPQLTRVTGVAGLQLSHTRWCRRCSSCQVRRG